LTIEPCDTAIVVGATVAVAARVRFDVDDQRIVELQF
jgi:hypothetical protein